jgi:hypothetical protein
MRICLRDMHIVDLATPGNDKSPLPPFKKGGFKHQPALVPLS